jgi:Protein of unknown function (DUF1583)
MLSPGTDNWTSTGLAPYLDLEGDFDIAVALDELKLGTPKETQNSALYLQVEFPDAAKTQANVLIVQSADGERQANAQVKVTDAGGKSEYRGLRVDPVDQVERMRMARRGKRLVLLYRVKGADHDQVLAETEVSDLSLPSACIRVMLHTGGAGAESEVLLKHFHAHAEKISPNPPKASP